MTKTGIRFLTVPVLAIFAVGASVAADTIHPPDVKLGLWETTSTTDSNGAPPLPPEVLSRLTPEQRAKMEAMAKARRSKGAPTRTYKNCLTKEKLNKALTFGEDEKKACKSTLIVSTSSRQEAHLECDVAGMKGGGEIRVDIVNSENVKGNSQMTLSSASGTTNVTVNFTSKWLGSSCGDVQ